MGAAELYGLRAEQMNLSVDMGAIKAEDAGAARLSLDAGLGGLEYGGTGFPPLWRPDVTLARSPCRFLENGMISIISWTAKAEISFWESGNMPGSP